MESIDTMDSLGVSPDAANRATDKAAPDDQQILNRLKQLGPWRMGVQVTDSIHTGDYIASAKAHSQTSHGDNDKPRKLFLRQMKKIYPDGIKGKRLLDIGCGAGGYCFWAREQKAEIGMGIDIREHWIKQAKFLRFHRTVGNKKRLQFEVLNLFDLPAENLFPFDIVLFKGMFFHLSDPIGGLRIAADHSRDILVFSSAVIWDQPDGSLKSFHRRDPKLHGGIGGLNWYPTGPGVCADLIRSLGFEEIVLTKHKRSRSRPDRGRLEIVAARCRGRLPDRLGPKI